MTRVKIEHYVPQFYLRRWATARDAIFVFDKPTGRIFQSAVDKAAAEGNFYDLPSQHGEDAQAIEKWLGTFEANLANVLKSAVADLDAGLVLSDARKQGLPLFLALQALRTAETRRDIEQT